MDEALSENVFLCSLTANEFISVVLGVRILTVKVNWSTRAGASCTRACKLMEVASPVAWTEANKCLATKEEFDLNTRGSPLEAGHCLLYYACSLPCCVRTRLYCITK
jgi:hypothetical protein